MTRPYGSFALAPHLMHVGVGGIIPDQNSGTCTAPPQREHVPMVDISLPLPDCISALDALRVGTSPFVGDGIANRSAPLALGCHSSVHRRLVIQRLPSFAGRIAVHCLDDALAVAVAVEDGSHAAPPSALAMAASRCERHSATRLNAPSAASLASASNPNRAVNRAGFSKPAISACCGGTSSPVTRCLVPVPALPTNSARNPSSHVYLIWTLARFNFGSLTRHLLPPWRWLRQHAQGQPLVGLMRRIRACHEQCVTLPATHPALL